MTTTTNAADAPNKSTLKVRNLRTRPRSSSSVGKIDLGDTVHATTNLQKESKAIDKNSDGTEKISKQIKPSKTSYNYYITNFKQLSSSYSWLTPLLIVLATYSCYFISPDQSPSNPIHMFIAISYQIEDTDMYGKGIKDLCFIFFYMIFFTFLRDFVMDVIIRPIALKCNINSKHKIKRIMEQVYYIFYYGISGPFGLYIMYGTDLWLFETKSMYQTYPNFNNPYLYKIFYLGQAAFWTQQACVLVLQLEKPRKDYYELCFHHIVTLLLIWLSYVFHFTKMGLAVYITMDISDFFLALSKVLNYLDSPLTSPVFGLFMLIWIYLRHYINIKILWSVITEFKTEGNYVLNFATEQYKCWISLIIVFTLIFALQVVNLYWLFLIFRILWRIIFKGVVADERSEYETESESDSEISEEIIYEKIETNKPTEK